MNVETIAASASSESPPFGLAPAEARAWIELQRRFAWVPEQVTPLLSGDEDLQRLLGPGSPLARGEGRPEPIVDSLEREVMRLERLGARVLPRLHADYPARLRPLVDAPTVLFTRGEVSALHGPCVAIVGARAATEPARQTARRLGRDLSARGVTVVSGLARGIDAAAHEGALAGGGRTVAVMASGLDEIYPPEHRRLADRIAQKGGAILTEMPMGSPPRRAHFPLRNRLISGLSAGVLVVEARRRSGSLITVRHALSQGREVFVVPGAVEGPFAEGTNQLLREGARPVLSAHDVLEDLGWPAEGAKDETRPAPGQKAPSDTVSADAERVLALLRAGPVSRSDLADRAGLGPGRLAQVLLDLEWGDRLLEDRAGRLHLNWG